jgi:hypothetical protein
MAINGYKFFSIRVGVHSYLKSTPVSLILVLGSCYFDVSTTQEVDL